MGNYSAMVERAAEALAAHVGSPTQEMEADGVSEETVRRAEIYTALAAGFDVEEMARELFVIDSDQPRAFALRIWFEARDDSPVKRLFRTHAQKFRHVMLEATP